MDHRVTDPHWSGSVSAVSEAVTLNAEPSSPNWASEAAVVKKALSFSPVRERDALKHKKKRRSHTLSLTKLRLTHTLQTTFQLIYSQIYWNPLSARQPSCMKVLQLKRDRMKWKQVGELSSAAGKKQKREQMKTQRQWWGVLDFVSGVQELKQTDTFLSVISLLNSCCRLVDMKWLFSPCEHQINRVNRRHSAEMRKLLSV